MNLESIQSEIQKTGLDDRLFFDHHERDPLAYRVVGLKPPGHVSRRWYYFIPARGKPRGLVTNWAPIVGDPRSRRRQDYGPDRQGLCRGDGEAADEPTTEAIMNHSQTARTVADPTACFRKRVAGGSLMNQMIGLILTALLLVPQVSLHAAAQTIKNNKLSVMYDDVSGRFAVTEKTTGKV